jgi:hypothetical protein
MSRICNDDLDVPPLLVPLEAVQILPHCNLNRRDDRSMLGESVFEKYFIAGAVLPSETDRGCDVEVMFEIRNMEEYRMSFLNRKSEPFSRTGYCLYQRTSVTPNNFTVGVPR